MATSIFAISDQEERHGKVKLPDELQQIMSGGASTKKKSRKQRLQDAQQIDTKSKKSMENLLYEKTLDPTYEDNITKFNDDFDMSLVLLNSE